MSEQHHHESEVEREMLAVLRETVHLLKELRTLLMTYTEAIAAFATQMATYNDAEDAAITALQGDVANLQAQILALQNSPGAISVADQALLDGIQARAATISTNLAALDAITPPAVPTTPAA